MDDTAKLIKRMRVELSAIDQMLRGINEGVSYYEEVEQETVEEMKKRRAVIVSGIALLRKMADADAE